MFHQASLDGKLRSDTEEHICPASEPRQLLENGTNLLPDPNRILNYYAMCILERGRLHLALSSFCTHPLKVTTKCLLMLMIKFHPLLWRISPHVWHFNSLFSLFFLKLSRFPLVCSRSCVVFFFHTCT